MSRFYVLTPFSRIENKAKLIEHLRPFNIIWHPLIHEEIKFEEEWICPVGINMPAKIIIEQPYYKLNYFLDRERLDQEGYYSFLCDDDFYEDDFFAKIEKQLAKMNFNSWPELIVVSMKRGLHKVGKHPVSTLVATQENMRVDKVGLEQMIIKGNLLDKLRFNHWSGADGLMAEVLVQHVAVIVYLPDIYVHFNYLESGRW